MFLVRRRKLEGVVKNRIFVPNGDTATWENPLCPDYCLATSSGNSSAVNVIACNAANADGTWCCAYDGNCCSGSSTFIQGFGTMFAEASLPTSGAASGSTAVPAGTTASTSTSASSASTSSPAATDTPISSISSKSSTTPTIVGAAVGIPLGLAVVAALFLFFRERGKRMRMGLGLGSGGGDSGVEKLSDGEGDGTQSGPVGISGVSMPAAGYFNPNAPNATDVVGEPMQRYEEMGVRNPHYELGSGREKPFEFGER
ncbi:hypothetical protein SBOR_4853 [Sclerotinia borealis F-4128]|uniref:Mid2 domain-containing protein n=1 Tax=Sclerotinia borealis (strain F-4128) TaxID=1432307 RepID=W9CFU7_SCLBF|nr:hypothetical protein SBOR_4853 [Sclerotinia borealis F-4128]